MRWLFVLLVACAGAPAPISNTSSAPAREPEPPPRTTRDGSFSYTQKAGSLTPATGSIAGAVRGRPGKPETNEPLIGVTVVATTPAIADAQTVLTDEHGAFIIGRLAPGSYTLTYFYLEAQQSVRVQVLAGHTAMTTLTGWIPGTDKYE
jgi:hypothetical protein